VLTSAKNIDAFSCGTKSHDFVRFVARQPIFDRSEKVFGYELLFRNGLEEAFHSDPDTAARSTLDSSLLFGIDALCDGRRAFINCTREVLLKDLITLLPSNLAVVEVLESVEADSSVIAACRRLKEAGYVIALDDFAPNDPREPLIGLADIIKVDVRATTRAERLAMIKRYGTWRCRMLAEKVETQEEFREAAKDGFFYFQGYFFRKPELMTAREIPANRLNYLRMLEIVSRSELDMKEIERLIKSEASVCYRLLRYLNSAVFSFQTEIHSVRHALGMLGEREIRRWVRLVATVGAGQEKSSELVLSALVRARFCELLSPRLGAGESDLFLLGLLSLMDVIMEIPMAQVLESVRLDQESKAVLLGGVGRLRPLYQLMLAQESGEWEATAQLARQLRLHDSEVADAYFQAVVWARGVNAP
jgi:EAL and modified HD-GYP domain-containing signal transduction protein